jgi:alpha-beta hydrolase superfamily lysophospholipase
VTAAGHGRQKDLAVELVLVHGSTQSPAGWDRLATALGTRGQHVAAIDLAPGRPRWTVAELRARGS